MITNEGSALAKGEKGEATPPAPGSIAEIDATDERAIRCAACAHAITTREAKTSVHGAHEHRRVNPSGVDFHLACYSPAPGCVAEGIPTTFWTWFPGYAWQIASCGGCREHLGWAFTSRDGSFFGLIVARLIEDE